jgi:hypothetical protein
MGNPFTEGLWNQIKDLLQEKLDQEHDKYEKRVADLQQRIAYLEALLEKEE